MLEVGVAAIKPEPGVDELPGTFLFSILLQERKNPIKLSICQSRGKNVSWGKNKIASDDVFRSDS